MEEGILEIQPCTQGALLEPFPDRFNVFHTEINMTNIFLKFFRFRISLHLSGTLLDLGTAKYELTYCPCTGPNSQMAPFLRSPVTSVLRILDTLVEMVGLRGATLCQGARLSLVGL